MRLPTATAQQAKSETARQFHEDLWRSYCLAAHQEHLGRLFLPASARGAGWDLIRLSWSLRKFWDRRGFHLCCKQAKETDATGQAIGIYVWLEPMAKTKTETAA